MLGLGIAKQPKSKDCGGKNGIVGVAFIGAGTEDIVQFSIREPEMAPMLAIGQSALNGKARLIMGTRSAARRTQQTSHPRKRNNASTASARTGKTCCSRSLLPFFLPLGMHSSPYV